MYPKAGLSVPVVNTGPSSGEGKQRFYFIARPLHQLQRRLTRSQQLCKVLNFLELLSREGIQVWILLEPPHFHPAPCQRPSVVEGETETPRGSSVEEEMPPARLARKISPARLEKCDCLMQM